MIAALLAALGFIVSFLVVNYQRDLEAAASRADLSTSVTYRFNEPGQWTLIWHVENQGPGVARNLQVRYVGLNTMCGTVTVKPSAPSQSPTSSTSSSNGGNDGWETGANCPGGTELIAAHSADGGEKPLLFTRPLEDEGRMFGLTAYSAVARELNPSESVWLELTFRSSKAFDDEMVPLVNAIERKNASAADNLKPLVERFSSPSISGVNITLGETSYDAIRLKG